MNLLKPLIFFVFFGLVGQNLSAHALWIQTKGEGKEGRSHDVIIYYAEPNDEHEVIADWWSDTANFTLWLISPDGQREKLRLQEGKNQFVSSFVPKTSGIYRLVINHNVAQLAGESQYQFNASASVNVGVSTDFDGTDAISKENGLFLLQVPNVADNKKADISIQLMEGEHPVPDNEISVIAPNGWRKTLVTNEKGMATVDAEWSGNYVFEGFKKEEVSGQEFTEIIRVITLLVEAE
ncbi:hypothetical protein RQM65_17385 [Pricia sp. S334]|uniref:DUF4198 domain-containing protein n=1 Tax=Pricia mediterranea TaxID=3076079 RepID=A0ABU3L9V3_9FLAO|nr:hypothetical protein [Pricia sp. S334]MDT7830445.1 hypothetical protein [Pricia sp. S334]